MYDHPLYLKTLSEFTRTLLTPYDVNSMFAELAERVTDVLDLLGCGVSLFHDGRLESGITCGPDVDALEHAQADAQCGPCVTSFTSGEIVAVPDLRAKGDEWPDYCRVAAEAGIRAVASIPMRMGVTTVGALNLYVRGAREWPEQDLHAAVVMSDMATVYLINASYHRRQVELNEQLQHALESRLVIEQAKGMLAARHEIGPEQAFERIRSHARSRNAAVRKVAEAVVSLGLDL